jgi:hypothetical protein
MRLQLVSSLASRKSPLSHCGIHRSCCLGLIICTQGLGSPLRLLQFNSRLLMRPPVPAADMELVNKRLSSLVPTRAKGNASCLCGEISRLLVPYYRRAGRRRCDLERDCSVCRQPERHKSLTARTCSRRANLARVCYSTRVRLLGLGFGFGFGLFQVGSLF